MARRAEPNTDEKITAVAAQVNDLDARVTGLEGKLGGIEWLADLEGRLGRLEQRVAAIAAAVNGALGVNVDAA